MVIRGIFGCVSIPLEQGNVFRHNRATNTTLRNKFQSLWNRAMSFDPSLRKRYRRKEVSIPLEQGNVFRQRRLFLLLNSKKGFNPFGTGQCLSTIRLNPYLMRGKVSIPLEQGNVFRRRRGVRALCGKASQSHFPTFSDV